jgi:fermentation-respiration switch protein FrsA (DUF1100 family)
VVEDIVADLRSRPHSANKKIALAGQAWEPLSPWCRFPQVGVDAIAEWSGLLPNQFFSQVQSLPPLLILHGEQDKQVPIVNARQLVRLCELKDFTCESKSIPARATSLAAMSWTPPTSALAFFRTYLWASLA